MRALVAFLAVWSVILVGQSNVRAAEVERLVQVIVDDTGARQDSEDPKDRSTMREKVIGLMRFIGQEFGKDTRVVVISQYSAQNVWSGDARGIRRSSQNAGLQAFLTSEWGGCSDLLRLPELLEENIFLTPAANHEYIFFSSLVHTGNPCSAEGFNAANALPDAFLDGLASVLKKHPGRVSFYWVHENSQSRTRSKLVRFVRTNGLSGARIKLESETRAGGFE